MVLYSHLGRQYKREYHSSNFKVILYWDQNTQKALSCDPGPRDTLLLIAPAGVITFIAFQLKVQTAETII